MSLSTNSKDMNLFDQVLITPAVVNDYNSKPPPINLLQKHLTFKKKKPNQQDIEIYTKKKKNSHHL